MGKFVEDDGCFAGRSHFEKVFFAFFSLQRFVVSFWSGTEREACQFFWAEDSQQMTIILPHIRLDPAVLIYYSCRRLNAQLEEIL